jgi:translation initiation factor 4G
LCSSASFEAGFTLVAEILDDIAIDAPMAFTLMAIMMNGPALDTEQQARIASKSEEPAKLLDLMS